MPKVGLRPVSPRIPEQLPGFVREDHPNFVAFIKAYYEWLENHGKLVYSERILYATADTLFLRPGAPTERNCWNGMVISCTNGPAIGQESKIIAYDPVARSIRVEKPFNIVPPANTKVNVFDKFSPSKLFEYSDIDHTVDDFVSYFRKEFLESIPDKILADKRLVLKHIKEFYRAKGTEKSFRFLFRILYDEEIDFYYPKVDVFRPSDAVWVVERVARAPIVGDTYDFTHRQITGAATGSTAYIEGARHFKVSNLEVGEFSLSNIKGTFYAGLTGLNFYDSPTTLQLPDFASDIDGFYVGQAAKITSGTGAGQQRTIILYDGTNRLATLESAWDTLPDGTSRYRISFMGLGEQIYTPNYIEPPPGSLSDPYTAYLKNGLYQMVVEIPVVTPGDNYNVGDPVSVESLSGVPARGIVASVVTSFYNGRVGTPPVSRYLEPYWGGIHADELVPESLGTFSSVSIGSNWFQLSSDAIQTDDYYNGFMVRVMSGTGAGQEAVIIDYTGSSQIAVLSTPWTVVPDYLSQIRVQAAAAQAAIWGVHYFRDVGDPLAANQGILDNEIVLADTETDQDDFFVGYTITLTGGTGAGQSRKIISYNGLDRIAVVDEPWDPVPDSTTSYSIFKTRGPIKKIVVLDFGLDFEEDPPVTIYSNTGSNGTARANLGAVGAYPGYWITKDGFPSSQKRIQDSYYWQDFSYVLKVGNSLDKYAAMVKKLLHPAGMKLFGDVIVESLIDRKILKSNLSSIIKTLDVQVFDASLTFTKVYNLVLNGYKHPIGFTNAMFDQYKFGGYPPNERFHLKYAFPNQNYWTKGGPGNTQLEHFKDMVIGDIVNNPNEMFVFGLDSYVRIDNSNTVSRAIAPIGPQYRTLERSRFTGFAPSEAVSLHYPPPNSTYLGVFGNTQLEVFAGVVLSDVISTPEKKINYLPDSTTIIYRSSVEGIPLFGEIALYDFQQGTNDQTVYNNSVNTSGQFNGSRGSTFSVDVDDPAWNSYGLVFTGSEVANFADLPVDMSAMTLLMVARTTNTASASTFINSNNGTDNGYSIDCGTNGSFYIRTFRDGQTYQVDFAEDTIHDNEWFFAAMRYDGQRLIGSLNDNVASSITLEFSVHVDWRFDLSANMVDESFVPLDITIQSVVDDKFRSRAMFSPDITRINFGGAQITSPLSSMVDFGYDVGVIPRSNTSASVQSSAGGNQTITTLSETFVNNDAEYFKQLQYTFDPALSDPIHFGTSNLYQHFVDHIGEIYAYDENINLGSGGYLHRGQATLTRVIKNVGQKSVLTGPPTTQPTGVWQVGAAGSDIQVPNYSGALFGVSTFRRMLFLSGGIAGSTTDPVGPLQGGVAYAVLFNRALNDFEIQSSYSYLRSIMASRGITLP